MTTLCTQACTCVCMFVLCVCVCVFNVCVCRACPAGSWRRRLVILVAFAKLAATLSSPRSFSLSLCLYVFLSPSLSGLTFRLSYFWKKKQVCCVVAVCAQDPALAAAAAPQKCTLASFLCRFFVLLLLLSSFNIHCFGPVRIQPFASRFDPAVLLLLLLLILLLACSGLISPILATYHFHRRCPANDML